MVSKCYNMCCIKHQLKHQKKQWEYRCNNNPDLKQLEVMHNVNNKNKVLIDQKLHEVDVEIFSIV